MPRSIKIHIQSANSPGGQITDEQCTDLANVIWMFMRSTPFDFSIEPDGRADVEGMDRAWEQYGRDASWSG
jgi:hypothetical protein